jgi:hypothetical protein
MGGPVTRCTAIGTKAITRATASHVGALRATAVGTRAHPRQVHDDELCLLGLL